MTSGDMRKDPSWAYFTKKTPEDKTTTICTFCGKVLTGGIYRAKQHFGGLGNTKICPKCPDDVRKEVGERFNQMKQQKDNVNMVHDFDDIGVGND